MSLIGAEAAHLGSPLFQLLDEINRAATSGVPLLAIAMTVALPDICASLKAPDGRSSQDLYKAWCKENLGTEFAYLTPEDLWSMRCGVLHNGRFGDMKHSVSRVIFCLPDGGGSFTNCMVNDAYLYSVHEFCKNFSDAVYQWFMANVDDEHVKLNVQRLMQYRPGGLAPYIATEMVIA